MNLHPCSGKSRGEILSASGIVAMGYSRQQLYEIRRNYQVCGSERQLDRLPPIPSAAGAAQTLTPKKCYERFAITFH